MRDPVASVPSIHSLTRLFPPRQDEKQLEHKEREGIVDVPVQKNDAIAQFDHLH